MLASDDRTNLGGNEGQRAFTLVEITVVLVVVALVTTMAMLGLDRILPETRIAGAAREVGAALRSTRTMAWTRGQPYWFQYDLDNLGFRSISPFAKDSENMRLAAEEEDRQRMPWTYLDVSNVAVEVWFSDGRRVREGKTEPIRFDPRGFFPYHYVIFIDTSDATDMNRPTYTLEVRGLSGEVEFYKGLPVIEAPTDADFAQ